MSVFIGGRNEAASFIGSIDELVVYQRALSSNEVSDYVRRTRLAINAPD